jgi:hypothetical protein
LVKQTTLEVFHTFRNTGLPVYVHDDELRQGFWAIATGCDRGVYLEHYMK